MNIAVIAGARTATHPVRAASAPGDDDRRGGGATSCDLPPGEVAKTLILGTQRGYVRALRAGVEAASTPTKVAVALALERGLGSCPSRSSSAPTPSSSSAPIPPVAGPGHDRVIVDESFREHPWLVFEAGRHDESVRVRTGDLLAATYAIVADICLD